MSVSVCVAETWTDLRNQRFEDKVLNQISVQYPILRKRPTPLSTYIREVCTIPSQKAKAKAIKQRNLGAANQAAFNENYCKMIEDQSKVSVPKPTKQKVRRTQGRR
ncbi:MAG: hypothetical protein ACRD8W_02010 [Nitrososphaeraceae archaeon]